MKTSRKMMSRRHSRLVIYPRVMSYLSCLTYNDCMIQSTWKMYAGGLRRLTLLVMLLLLAGQTSQPAAQPSAQPAAPSATQPVAASITPSAAPATAIPGLPVGANVAIIPVHGEIVSSTLDYLKFRLEASVKNGATLLVIELDTPGGDMLAAIGISRLLRSSNIPTLAWVKDSAYSAGILIASSCDAIVMSPTSAMGDCAPIRVGMAGLMPLPATERAKILSPLLEAFDANAKSHGYDMALFQAMCILDVRVYEIREPKSGEVRFVNQDDYRVMVQAESFDKVTSESSGPDRPIGMAMTLATPAERGRWELIRQVHDGKTLLTVNHPQAASIGLSKGQIATVSQLEQALAAKTVRHMPITWSQHVGYWLSVGWVRALLVLLMLVAAYFEMQAPGIGLGGAVALVSLGLLVFGPMLAGMAEWWQVVLVVIGLGMLIVEIAAAPGFGFLGAGGLMAIFIGLTLMGVPSSTGAFDLPPSAVANRLQAAVLWMVFAVILSGVAFVILTRYFGELPLMNKLMLQASQTPSMAHAGGPVSRGEDGGQAGLPLTQPSEPVSGDDVLAGGQIKAGDVGRAMGTLRPSGRAKFGEHIVDVISEGQWIEPGQKIRVVESRGNRIVVVVDVVNETRQA